VNIERSMVRESRLRNCHAGAVMNLVAIGLLLLIAGIATIGGVWFGIVVLAPRITRLLDRPGPADEEPVDRPD
jgi:hypothetical protein